MADDDVDMTDAHAPPQLTDDDSDERFPNRPRNHGKTLPFHELFQDLFDPLNDTKRRPSGPAAARRKQGPHGPRSLNSKDARRKIIQRFIARWRAEVGNDFYPVMRLIVPEKDRDRAMYGLKEKTIGKLLVQIVKIDKDSEDAQKLLNWKLPAQRFTASMTGDFAGRCYEVISKRPIRTSPGDLTIEEVNGMLDQMSAAQKEEQQRVILQQFYQRMNADELMWVIRILLRHMKIGASESTIFKEWHEDAELLFNISSSLKRVCWELADPTIRLQGEETNIELMQCFQPQLAQFQAHSFDKMVERLQPTEDDKVFWIEQKLDGERIQLHMIEDDTVPGNRRFNFWSRKAKDYTYLYGAHLEDDNSSLARHLHNAFKPGVRNLILDGEMITWNTELDKIEPFGTLKTAAKDQQDDPVKKILRPVFKVFDILYLNDTPLTRYTLRDRRKALTSSIDSITRRMEIHDYEEATSADAIEPLLRKVVEDSAEGLVVKNPRSMYHLNKRSDDWIKVKPEYMSEFGESLDCIVIGGYYGSGHRGGNLSSFLCGLMADESHVSAGADPLHSFSFFKVGGGMTAADYQAIRHHTEGKWRKWDVKKPPVKFISLAGGAAQIERPDVWIRADESVVIEAKAASVSPSDSFATKYTLRFPRFKKLRLDKDCKSCLSVSEFTRLRQEVAKQREEKKFELDHSRRKRPRLAKQEIAIAGVEQIDRANAFLEEETKRASVATKSLFQGLAFIVMTESTNPKKTKGEIEAFIKVHGGSITHSRSDESAIPLAEKRLVQVASVQKEGKRSVVKPQWLFDCVTQAEADSVSGRSPILLPYEPNHMFWIKPKDDVKVSSGADAFMDSYARDISSADELRLIIESMPKPEDEEDFEMQSFVNELEHRGQSFDKETIGWIFRGCTAYLAASAEDDAMETGNSQYPHDMETEIAATVFVFAGGRLARELEDDSITHVVVAQNDGNQIRELRKRLSTRQKQPRFVSTAWIQDSWKEKTRIDEERFEVR